MKPPRLLPSGILAALGAILLGVGLVVNAVSAVITFFVWWPSDLGSLEILVWGVLAGIPSVIVCIVIGTTWASPLYLASLVVSVVGVARRGWTRWLGIPSMVLAIGGTVVAIGVWVLFALGGTWPWTPPPAIY